MGSGYPDPPPNGQKGYTSMVHLCGVVELHLVSTIYVLGPSPSTPVYKKKWLVDTRVFYDLDLQDISSNHPNSIRISIHASKNNVSFQIHNLSILKAPVRSEGKVNIPAVCKRSTSSSSASSSSSSSSFDNNNKPNNNDNKPK